MQIDAVAVGNVVAKYALTIGCDRSNMVASVSWAMRTGFDTFSAIRAGKSRADILRARQSATPSDQLKHSD